MIFCARATRGLPSTQLGTLSLSKGRRPSLNARSGRSISPHPWRDNERAWKDQLFRSTRAIEDRPGYPLKAKERIVKMRAVGIIPAAPYLVSNRLLRRS